MDKKQIKERCRKVYVEVRGGRIFHYLGGKRNEPGEYEFVQMFRRKEYAEQIKKEQQHSTPMHWQSHEEWIQKREIVAFYLVPAKKIDD